MVGSQKSQGCFTAGLDGCCGFSRIAAYCRLARWPAGGVPGELSSGLAGGAAGGLAGGLAGGVAGGLAGGLADGLAAGLVKFEGDVSRALRYASAVAGLSTTKPGTAPAMPTRAEVEQYREFYS